MPRNKIDPQPCKYNSAVDCDRGARSCDCHKCGWNPREELRRKTELVRGGKNGER